MPTDMSRRVEAWTAMDGMRPMDTAPTAPSSEARRRVRRRPGLDRDQLLVAALRLIDAEGVEALSMRRLGKELDRDPMQLYRYAPSKDALLDGVVELVFSRLEVPPAGHGEWP